MQYSRARKRFIKQTPDHYTKRYGGKKKSTYAAMATAMDEGIGNITGVFRKHGIWDNTVLFFSTDNGGFLGSAGSNAPLREGKGTLYEGGIRGVAFAHGRGIAAGGVSHGLMHITDIFPTIAHLAGAEHTSLSPPLDGLNMWGVLSRGEDSPRQEILINIDPLEPSFGSSLYPRIFDTRVRSAIIRQPWKLITGHPGRSEDHKQLPGVPSVQLYDLEADPSETQNLADKRPDIVKSLLERLKEFNETSVTPYYPAATSKWPAGLFLPFDHDPSHLI